MGHPRQVRSCTMRTWTSGPSASKNQVTSIPRLIPRTCVKWMRCWCGSRRCQGSGQIRAKIYAKREPFPVQSGTRELCEVFHTVLRDTVGVTDPTRVQSVLPIEDHVVPANRADVRQQGGVNALF